MLINKPYHQGELAVQQRTNEIGRAQKTGRILGKTIPAPALDFIHQQPMAVIGSIDPAGNVWASILVGKPGFMGASDNHTLMIDLSQPCSDKDDPLWNNLMHNPNVGLLVIELGSRRRLRINGQVTTSNDKKLIINVEQAYPNCPKYIQRRHWSMIDTPHNPTPATQGKKLTDAQQQLITHADTFFVTSAYPGHGVDASHRGGHPGFVHMLNEQTLRIPDFVGNSMFNTLGNFVSYPHAGLAFIDFVHGRILQLTGQPEILWDHDDPQDETGGTHRYWQYEITGWRESSLALHFAWELLDNSPFLPKKNDCQSLVCKTHPASVFTSK